MVSNVVSYNPVIYIHLLMTVPAKSCTMMAGGPYAKKNDSGREMGLSLWTFTLNYNTSLPLTMKLMATTRLVLNCGSTRIGTVTAELVYQPSLHACCHQSHSFDSLDSLGTSYPSLVEYGTSWVYRKNLDGFGLNIAQVE